MAERIALHIRQKIARALPSAARRSLGRRARMAAGYACAVLGVALITALIGQLLAWHAHIANLSMLYLLPVLLLATVFGRGPAVLASVLAFLAYDFYFVAPIHTFTVNDALEWLSLTMLLLTALVTGQLTATLRIHAREARQQQQRTATLYGLAQLIAAGTDLNALLQEMALRVVAVFSPAGVQACAIILPGPDGSPIERAVAPPTGPAAEWVKPNLESRRRLAEDVLARGAGASRTLEASSRPGGSRQSLSDAEAGAITIHYAPLRGGDRTVGVLAVAGTPVIGERLQLPVSGTARSPRLSEPLAALFDAFCSQIALAIEHATLEQAAVHAEALRESDRLKDVLLGSVTHDLRTPLASIKAITTSLLQPGIQLSDADRQELVESIDGSVDRLSRLVSNLLDLSRLESGVAEPQREWHLLGDIVATVLDQLDRAGELRGRSVEVAIPAESPLVYVDHEQIEQVLTNLVENAVKYSPAGSPIWVSANVPAGQTELAVTVSDRGIGVAAHERVAIFDKFYRSQRLRLSMPPQRSPAGTGLGLAICKAIVAVHGGRIWAEDREGGGTHVTFTLPIRSDIPRGELPEIGTAVPAREAGEAHHPIEAEHR